MKHCSSITAFVFLITVVDKSHQLNCAVEDQTRFRGVVYYNFRDYRNSQMRKSIHCQDLNITSDFHIKLQPLINNSQIMWLEINDTSSPEIASGAFASLNKLPDLRINAANVRFIQPGAFDGLLNLSQLSLKDNKISHLNANCFSDLNNLLILDLSSNNIADIDVGTFNGLEKLTSLFLTNNLITELAPNLLENLTRIEVLNLASNKLSKLDQGLFKNLSNLNYLWLNDNNLHYFDFEVVSNNHKLQGLYLDHNILTKFANLSFPNTLQIFNCSNNVVQSMNFLRPTEIKIVDLTANGIMSLDQNFFQNLTVRDLYLDDNLLSFEKNLQVIQKLVTVETISLSSNGIVTLKTDIFKNNKRLKTLNLSKNSLSTTPEIPNTLLTLNLASNRFNSFLDIAHLVKLETLNMSSNNLTAISFNSLQNLKSLRFLNLRNNKIQTIKVGCFRDLKSLRDLDLSSNNITSLQIGVFVGLDSLYRLDLSHNHLTALSEGIFHNLRWLKTLNLASNDLNYLNVENTLSHLHGLREIDLAGNNWSCSLLMTIIKQHRIVRLEEGVDYNVTNVRGIACKYDNKSSGLGDLSSVVLAKIDARLRTNNNLLVFILFVFVLGLVLKYGVPYFRKEKKLGGVTSEQELQLIN